VRFEYFNGTWGHAIDATRGELGNTGSRYSAEQTSIEAQASQKTQADWEQVTQTPHQAQ